MKQKEKDELFAAQLAGNLRSHLQMLGDGVRNRKISEAIRRTVSSETSFLDVGAGCGVWSILAAQLGARRVVAVEIEESLIPVIFRHAQENGVADKIEIIHADVDDLKLREKFDVVVSEVFGHDAFGEATLRSFINVRERFLAPGGALIPEKMEMYAVPVRVENPVLSMPAELSVKTDFINALRINYVQEIPFAERAGVRFLAEPQKLFEAEFQSISIAHSLNNYAASWRMENLDEANAFIVYSHSIFGGDIRMNAFESRSWSVAKYEFKPFEQKSGEIKFSVVLDAAKGNWSVSLPSHPQIKAQNFSPVFAFARSKMAQQMTLYKRVKPPKKHQPEKPKKNR